MPIPRAYRNTRNAPWDAPDAPECPCCDETIIEASDHDEWCEIGDYTPGEVREEIEILNEPSYEPGGY